MVPPGRARDRRLVLASASPARLNLLRQAGLAPEVVVSGVDEQAVTAPRVAELVALLASAKASAVARRETDALVIGCDSLLEFRGRPYGKPTDAADARLRWQRMAGHSGTLHTGQALFEVKDGAITVRTVGVSTTEVYFATPTEREIDAYVASGEPLAVAGAFTLDGLGASFVRRVEGDPAAVVGLSLQLLRTQLARVGLTVTDLWRR
ncbi:septum formation inhibitor Maf [Modestobacter sp. I12A-02628]|uniref:Nucleoside triphosphate pyrophosphatase n=1 Tax=Goekera deserti TaxID=2497753 RepID=A0A7K3W850_9ACTN|nr:septum formation inhibitor Maf [Goekera deserti]NDI49488.1 septum formation inhibitor Maf [Goekera deserti]NEL52638.1 septum formation inhibitor Maf [Goekera deserti]